MGQTDKAAWSIAGRGIVMPEAEGGSAEMRNQLAAKTKTNRVSRCCHVHQGLTCSELNAMLGDRAGYWLALARFIPSAPVSVCSGFPLLDLRPVSERQAAR